MSVGCVPIGSSSVGGVNQHPQERTILFVAISLLKMCLWGRMGMFIKIYVGSSFLVLRGLINMLAEHFRGG